MTIDYDHTSNAHTLLGASRALEVLVRHGVPRSLLDVGCGTGTWLAAAVRLGVAEVCGIDGVDIPAEVLHVPRAVFRQIDLTRPWCLDRSFEVALCLEVAEHLEDTYAGCLVESLTRHAETIYFSAACPNQHGQHHVNCRWPTYWQALFNDHGFSCDDRVRWELWDVPEVEPWYRQNMFAATRAVDRAGREPRIRSVVHPEMVERHAIMSAKARRLFDAPPQATRPEVSPLRRLASRVRSSARRFVHFGRR